MMKKKLIKEICQFCLKEYMAEIWGKVSVFPLTKSHGCKEQLEIEEARRKVKYL